MFNLVKLQQAFLSVKAFRANTTFFTPQKALALRSLEAVVIILLPLMFSFALALDIYIPIVPLMIDVFKTTQQAIQLTLTLFLVIMGVGQLVIGSISDRFGRRISLIISVLFYLLGSALCAASNSIGFFLFARCLQAMGGCGAVVSGNAIVRDLYLGEKAGKVYSYINGSIALSPLLAPLIGGQLYALTQSWRSPFIFLAVFSLFTFCLVLKYIDDTRTFTDQHFSLKRLLKTYAGIVVHKKFLAYTTCLSIANCVIFIYFCISPYLLIGEFNVSTEAFGLYFAVAGIVFAVGSFIGASLSEKLGLKRLCVSGGALLLFGGLVMTSWYYLVGSSIAGLLVPMGLLSLACAFCLGAGAAGALMNFAENAGCASAVLGFMQYVSSAIVGTLATLVKVTNVLPLAIIAVIGGVVIVFLQPYLE